MTTTMTQAAMKDAEQAHPVASAWRTAFEQIVAALATGDYSLSKGIGHVEPISPKVAQRIEQYIRKYGETLTSLTDETWTTSASQWMLTHWDVLVDLRTLESGDSDLVLHARVFDDEDGFRVVVDSVHVP